MIKAMLQLVWTTSVSSCAHEKTPFHHSPINEVGPKYGQKCCSELFTPIPEISHVLTLYPFVFSGRMARAKVP